MNYIANSIALKGEATSTFRVMLRKTAQACMLYRMYQDVVLFIFGKTQALNGNYAIYTKVH